MATLTRIRCWLVVFVIGLVLSGVTAFPLVAETDLLVRVVHAGWSPLPDRLPELVAWLDRVHDGLVVTGRDYPFIAYGTDWLIDMSFGVVGIVPLLFAYRGIRRLPVAG
jgi:hypothetical protein